MKKRWAGSVLRAILCSYLLVVAAPAAATASETKKAAEKATRAKYRLPADAVVVEEQSLGEAGHADRMLVLWMSKPTKHPTDYRPDELYTCPDYTRGSYYRGPTRVSLAEKKTGRIINTIEIKGDDGDDCDIPYAIRKGHYYQVPGNPKEGVEARPHLLWLKDYNGDGKPEEFALFNAEACMGLGTTLIGYSEHQDKVIQYPVVLREGSDASTNVIYWCDYLFNKEPESTGYWKYEIDYRGRGGALETFEIRYNREKERFEGTHTSVGGDD